MWHIQPQLLYSTSHQEAQQAASSQTSNKHQAHKPTSSLSLIPRDPVAGTHHAAGSQIPIGNTEEQLDDEEVEEVTSHNSTPAIDVAE